MATLKIDELYEQFVGDDGGFGMTELRKVLNSIGADSVPEDDNTLRSLLNRLDVDEDGIVSKSDFCTAMTAYLKPSRLSSSDSDEAWDTSVESPLTISVEDEVLGGPQVWGSLSHIFTELQSVHGLSESQLRRLSESITSFADLQNAELREEEAALRRQLDRMTEAHNQLSEDCARLDNELQDTQDVKHRVTEYQTENTRLQATVEELEAEVEKQRRRAADAEAAARDEQAQRTQMEAEVDRLKAEGQSLRTELKMLDADRDMRALTTQQLLEERDDAVAAVAKLEGRLADAVQRVRVLEDEVMHKDEALSQGQTQTQRLEEAVLARDTEIETLKSEMDEVKALMASLEESGSGMHTGSVLNEIEDLVLTQMREEAGDIEANNRMTVALLRRLLPRIEETRLDRDPITSVPLNSDSDSDSDGDEESNDSEMHVDESKAEAVAGVLQYSAQVECEVMSEQMQEQAWSKARGSTSSSEGEDVQQHHQHQRQQEAEEEKQQTTGTRSEAMKEDDAAAAISSQARMSRGEEEQALAGEGQGEAIHGHQQPQPRPQPQQQQQQAAAEEEEQEEETQTTTTAPRSTAKTTDTTAWPMEDNAAPGLVTLESVVHEEDDAVGDACRAVPGPSATCIYVKVTCPQRQNNDSNHLWPPHYYRQQQQHHHHHHHHHHEEEQEEEAQGLLGTRRSPSIGYFDAKRPYTPTLVSSSTEDVSISDVRTGTSTASSVSTVTTASSSSAAAGAASSTLSETAVEDKLNQVLRLYAASTQHLAGVKIVTPETARAMSVAELRSTTRVLQDLIGSRNRLLLRTLAERDQLRNEIHLKQHVLRPVLDIARAQAAVTTTTITTTTPPPSSRSSAAGVHQHDERSTLARNGAETHGGRDRRSLWSLSSSVPPQRAPEDPSASGWPVIEADVTGAHGQAASQPTTPTRRSQRRGVRLLDSIKLWSSRRRREGTEVDV